MGISKEAALKMIEQRMNAVKKRNMPDILIAIDPDVDKNGFARLEVKQRLMHVCSLPFPELIIAIKREKRKAELNGYRFKVLIEAGWLNKAHWHLYASDTKEAAAAKGNAAGRNHETGRKIAEFCDYFKVEKDLIKPLRKVWKSKDGKISHEEITAFMTLNKRSNQEERDAALIAWEYAGLPIRMNSESSRR